MIRILSWNIRQGGGSRVSLIYKELLRLNPEIIVLSEFRNNKNGALIRNKLVDAGYLHQMVGEEGSHANTVYIGSKIPFNSIHCQDADKKYKSAILKAQFEAFTLYGMYLPHKKKHKLFDFILSEIENENECIFVGDFNTGKNYIDQKSDSFMYSEYLFKMEEMGMIDAFRYIHGDIKTFSWYSHQGNGYRYDHNYIHKNILPVLTGCYYLHDWRENKLSDHSPMILELA